MRLAVTMPSPKLRPLIRYERPNDIRYITCSCFQRLPLLRGSAARDVVLDAIFRARESGSFKIYAWVVMPSHIHMLICPNLPDFTVPDVLRQIKEPAARSILKEWRSCDAPILNRLINTKGQTQFWLKGGGYDRNIYSKSEFNEKFSYIHENPVKAGLVSRASEWRWSSAAVYDASGDMPYQPDPLPTL